MNIVLRRKRNTENLWKIYSGIVTVLFLVFFILCYGTEIGYNIDTVTEQVSENENEVASKTQNNVLYKKLKAISNKSKSFRVVMKSKNIIVTIDSRQLFENDTTQFTAGAMKTLNMIFKEVNSYKKNINSIAVLSHTMQKDDHIPNEAVSDRILTATRAAKISAYIQQKKIVKPENILSIGCGQFSPLLKNGSKQERKKNERIEIKIQNK